MINTIEGYDVPVLLHMGSSRFDPDKFKPIKNQDLLPTVNKPLHGTGLWTSPKDSEFGWNHWCYTEQYSEWEQGKSFTIKLGELAKVVLIDSLEDLKALPIIEHVIEKTQYKIFYVDYESLAEKYDAIWLTLKGQDETRLSRPLNLYGWDCESVLILNKEVVQEVHEN